MLKVVLMVCMLVLVLGQRSYTINSVVSNILVSGCTAVVREDFELDFTGSYSNFFRAIQDYTTSTTRESQITNFGVTALTNNVQVVQTTVQRPNAVASRLNVQFSSALSSIGITRFRFVYTILNFVSASPETNENVFIWNTKWQIQVGVVNTTITFATPQDMNTTFVSSSQPVTIEKTSTEIFVPITNLPSVFDYDLRVSTPLQPQLNCLRPVPIETPNPATSGGAIAGYSIAGAVVVMLIVGIIILLARKWDVIRDCAFIRRRGKHLPTVSVSTASRGKSTTTYKPSYTSGSTYTGSDYGGSSHYTSSHDYGGSSHDYGASSHDYGGSSDYGGGGGDYGGGAD